MAAFDVLLLLRSRVFFLVFVRSRVVGDLLAAAAIRRSLVVRRRRLCNAQHARARVRTLASQLNDWRRKCDFSGFVTVARSLARSRARADRRQDERLQLSRFDKTSARERAMAALNLHN